jgi:hypothetical protein
MHLQARTVEETIGRIASSSKGIVTRDELLAAGITRDQIRERVRKGLLLREYRGVYRVGHRAPNVEARYLAAVRACGEGSLLAGRAAGHLWGLVKGEPPPPEVIGPTERRVAGVTTRRTRRLDPRDAATRQGVPVTTVARTLVDLARDLDEDALARACHEAGVRYRVTPRQVEVVLARLPTSPGAGKLRRVLTGDIRVSLSKLEARFLTQLGDQGLPLPVTNRVAGSRRVDCRWRERRLTVELDGYRYHNSRHSWELDRQREREARRRGDEFRRYTYKDVFDEPGFMLCELRALLSH